MSDFKTSDDLEWIEEPSDIASRHWILCEAGTRTPYEGEVEVADDEL